jgi:putative endonuclease
MDRQTLGKRGEDLAVDYLETLGWRVVDRRWRCATGEIDVVAVEPGTPPVTVFCEVKTRSGLGFGEPLEAITVAKMARLRLLAGRWVEDRHTRSAVRIDGIGVLMRPGRQPLITHVRGIS